MTPGSCYFPWNDPYMKFCFEIIPKVPYPPLPLYFPHPLLLPNQPYPPYSPISTFCSLFRLLIDLMFWIYEHIWIPFDMELQ